ncbi:hypothetical protein J2X01_003937 [Arthrobacter ginsengisoli]|uniref:Uncharacterized protein n=1 Tax=Arthrobacter ginsengisoli TaxID=1356565 RepID=A0ABU1UHI0_9MICC|nr:hypothetical protein [Arthrobacter ginsengisoli]MDR7084624.1 hypothetical protein [Arthrobacter ginsengisoli]
MDPILELTDDMAGAYSVRTSSGSAYLVSLDEPRHIVRLAAETAPVRKYTALDAVMLRRDGTATCREAAPALSTSRLQNAAR